MVFSNRYITALDIQDTYIKCIQVRYSPHSWSIQKSAFKEIPPSEDNEGSSHHVHTAHTIRSLLQEMDMYPPKNLVTSIGGSDVAVRLLALPPVADRKNRDIEEMIRYELMMHLPVNIEQMGYDYRITERSDAGTKILTAAAKRSVLNRHLKLLSLAGLYPDVVTTSSLMLFNAFAAKFLPAPLYKRGERTGGLYKRVEPEQEYIRSGRLGMVCLRDSSGDVVVCEDGNLTYARSFTYQTGGSKEQLVREIRSSFDTYSGSRTYEEEDERRKASLPSFSSIYLMTEDGQLPAGLTEYDLPQIVPGSRWEIYPTEDDLTSGLALVGASFDPSSIPLSPLRINLLKQILQEKRAAERKEMRARLGRMAPAMAIVALLAASVALRWQARRAEEELHFLENFRQANKHQSDRISELADTEKRLQKQIESLHWAADDHPMVSYRLYQTARTIPDSLWLKEVYIPERQTSRKKKQNERQSTSKLYVVGYAHEQHQIEEFLGNLRKCDCFSDVKQENTSEVRLAGERVLEFKIGLTSETRDR